MEIAFRVDASHQIGTGHLMRCLTLADALKSRGVKTHFVCRHIPDHLIGLLVQKDHSLTRLPEDQRIDTIDAANDLTHSHWLGVSQTQDAHGTLQALNNEDLDWLVVDHYALDFRWESAMRQIAKRIMVIDDIADRSHDCDILLDQNLYADMETRYIGKVPSHCQCLLGPRYALLRDEFRQLCK